MPRIAVRRPGNADDVVVRLLAAVTPAFIALKLAGVVRWSWWWVLSPAWLAGAALVLLASGLTIAWCLGRWPFILVSLFRRRSTGG